MSRLHNLSVHQERKLLGEEIRALAKESPLHRKIEKALKGEVFVEYRIVAPVLLQALLSRPNKNTREAANRLLRRFGPPHTPDAVKDLLRLAQDSHADTQLTAVVCLGSCELQGMEDAAAKLLTVMKDGRPEIRRAAVETWKALGVDLGARGVPALVSRLQDEAKDVRQEALATLAWLGPEAEDAVEAIIKVMVSDQEEDIRQEAVRALLAVDPSDRLSVRRLAREQARQAEVLRILQRVGPDARALRRKLQSTWADQATAGDSSLPPGGGTVAQDPLASHPDGPEEPNSFWWGGKRYHLSPISCKILSQVWGRDKIAIGKLEQAVWGQEDVPDTQVKSALHRLNNVLCDARVSWNYGKSGAYVVKVTHPK